MYVLISFSRNWTARRLDSSIFAPLARQLAKSKRNTDCEPSARISTVLQVVSAVVELYVAVIVLIPIACPVFRPRVNDAEPIPIGLESRISAVKLYGVAVHSKRMIRAEIERETVVRDPVAVVAAALPPVAVVGLPAARAVVLPRVLLLNCM
jgi:hypothetical protein